MSLQKNSVSVIVKTWEVTAGVINYGTHPIFTIPAKSLIKKVSALVETAITGYTAKAITSIVTATDVITIAAHGFASGLPVQATTTTTLPAGLELLTTYYVKLLTVDTFQLVDDTGAVIDITDAGTGTHTLTPITIVATLGDEDTEDLFLEDTFAESTGFVLSSEENSYYAAEKALNFYVEGLAKTGKITFVIEMIDL